MRPWEPLTQSCARCDLPAVKRCSSGGTEDVAFGCEFHARQISNEWCDEYGGSMTEPIRFSWNLYLSTQVPGLRWIGTLLVVRHNRRFERRKRAALRDLGY